MAAPDGCHQRRAYFTEAGIIAREAWLLCVATRRRAWGCRLGRGDQRWRPEGVFAIHEMMIGNDLHRIGGVRPDPPRAHRPG